MKLNIITIIAASLFLSACAHEQTYGDRMLAVSDQSKELAGNWNDSNKLLVKGEENQKEGSQLIAKGKKLIAEGDEYVSKGNNLVNKGKDQINEAVISKQKSEKTFQQTFPSAK